MPQIVSYIFSLVVGLLMPRIRQPNSHSRRNYIIALTVLLTFFYGCRGLYALNDTSSYHWTYTWATNVPFLRYIQTIQTDYLYYLLNWILSNLGIPWQVFLIVQTAFVFGVFGLWVYENSEDPMLSYLMFVSLLAVTWATAIRYAFASAFLLLAYRSFQKSDKRGFVAFSAIAFFFHATSLVFIPFWFLKKVPLTNASMAVCSAVCIALWIFRNRFLQMVNILARMLNRNEYTEFWNEEPGMLIFAVIAAIAIAWCLRKTFVKKFPQKQEYYYSLFLMLLLLALGGGVVVRFAMYYGIYICLLVPCLVRCFKRDQVQIATMLAVLLLSAFYIQSSGSDPSVFYFFWQERPVV